MDKKPFMISVSKLNDADTCLRHWHWQHVIGVKVEIPPDRQRVIDIGTDIDRQVEEYMLGKPSQVSGAAAVVAKHYPIPGQSCVQVQRWVRCDWAGAPLIGKIDLLTGPSTVWSPLNRAQKKGQIRVTDLKVVKDLKWAKTLEQLDSDRQTIAYAVGIHREANRPVPNLFEVSQVSVERTAPYRAQALVRGVGINQATELEERDRPLVATMRAALAEESTLELPAAERATCERWYGSECPFYARCHGARAVHVSDSLGALLDAGAGRGSGGAGRTIDSIAEGTAPAAREESVKNLISPPDAAQYEERTMDAVLRSRKTIMPGGKQYLAIQGDRHGKHWELRCFSGAWKFYVGDKLDEAESAPGFHQLSAPSGTHRAEGKAPGCEEMDIVGLRTIYIPQLEAWDAEVAPVAEAASLPVAETKSAEEEIFGDAAQQVAAQTEGTTPAVDEGKVKELTSVGLTENRARNIVTAGHTLESLRSGAVKLIDLTRVPGIGKTVAAQILAQLVRKEEQKSELEVKPEQKPEEKPEQKPEEKPEQKPEEKPEQKPEEKPEQKPEPRPGSRYELFVDCRPVGRADVREFSDVLRPYLKSIAEAKKVPDALLVEPGYLLPGLLTERLIASPPASCVIVVDSSDKLWKDTRHFWLDRRSSLVVGTK